MTILDEFHQDQRRVLDRLVDGELSGSERHQLLAALDDEPGGWRSCALAFLEGQELRWQLSRVAAEPLVAQLSAAARPAPSARSHAWLAIAAAVLVAFGLGTLVPRDGGALTADVPPQIASSVPPEPEARHDAPPDPASPAPRNRWQTLTLKPVGGDGSSDPIQIRVMDEAIDDPAKLLAERTPLAATFARELERAGWEVDRRQQWLPIELTDGRQVVVPVEEINLRAPSLVPF